ncbi:MAG: 4'-phosphopantetheinyl transferase superfamily protein [Spartobacteria bacterium]
MSQRSEKPGVQINDAHVFLCRTDSAEDPDLLERYHALLDPEERERFSRFRFERDRRAFLISHALVRVSLSQFADVSPVAWRFRRNAHGRPEIDQPTLMPLRFNLSHTRDLVACVVRRGLEVGIDVEAARDCSDLVALAERFFAPSEAAALRALPVVERSHRFYSLWTLKEAYAKARGLGFAFPFHRVAFQITKGVIETKFDPEIADRAAAWSFSLMRPTPQHWLAVALQVSGASGPHLKLNWFLPLTNATTADPCPIIAATPR